MSTLYRIVGENLETVGELIEILKELDPDIPIEKDCKSEINLTIWQYDKDESDEGFYLEID